MSRVHALVAIMAAFALSAPLPAAEEQFQFAGFGTVTLYSASPQPRNVVLFASGDGGWNKGVVDMARALTGLDAAVAGFDLTHYLGQLNKAEKGCAYPAGDLQQLGQFVERRLGLREYQLPVLVGYSSGATLVYAALAQAPPDTFAGAISLGFCPDLDLARPPCRGRGLEWVTGPKGKGVVFAPAANLAAPWIAFQGEIDQVCDAAATREFVGRVPGGQLVSLPKVGHGFSVPRNWMPQFRAAFASLAAKPDLPAGAPATGVESHPADGDDLDDLPLVTVPASGAQGDAMAVIVSGDGGWAGIDREIATILASQGVPVVGLNSLKYFWSARTPDQTGRDLERIVRRFSAEWHARRVLLIGYSFGADVLPFMVSRLPAEMRSAVGVVALLAPGKSADFEFHVGSWLGHSGEDAKPIAPEIAKLAGTRVLCLWAQDDRDSVCPSLAPELATSHALPGGHHFDGDYGTLAKLVLSAASAPSPTP